MPNRAHDHKTQGTRIVLIAAAFLSLIWSLPAVAQMGPPSSVGHEQLLLEAVELRPGVTADIHLEVFVNDARPCHGRTILAVPGFAHTAATLRPLAEAILTSRPAGQFACRLVALDLPGRGGSSPPSAGLPFGFLSLDDYVTVVLASLERLPERGIRINTVLAHSQGGLLVQLAQQRLAEAGSSLRQAFNVRRVVLLASVPSGQVPWFFADSGVALSVLSSFLVIDPVLGPIAAIPDIEWPTLFFSNQAGTLAPTAPTPAAVSANGYSGPEPLFSALQLVGSLDLLGLPPTPRLQVDAGIFGAGARTTLQLVSFEQDQIVRPDEVALLYTHLTGDPSGAGVVEVGGEFAVHDMYVSDPEGLLRAIAGIVPLR